MRRASTIGIGLGIALSMIVACASFGEGTPRVEAVEGGPDASPPSEASVDAVEAGPQADGGGGKPMSCAQRSGAGDLLCEDFDDVGPLDGWDKFEVGGGAVNVTTNGARSGSALRAFLPVSFQSSDGRITRDVSWSPPFYVRFYLFVSAEFAELAQAPYHVVVLFAFSEIAIAAGRLVVNQFNASGFYKPTPDPFPQNQWTCVEWKLAPTETTLSIAGETVVNETGKSVASTTFASLGLSTDQTNAATRSILLDDVVVSTTPIGCD